MKVELVFGLKCIIIILTFDSMSSRIFNPCELGYTLLQHKVEVSKLSDWICLAHTTSRYNSSLVTGFDTNPHHNLQYGLFQIGNYYFCYDEYKQQHNDCHLNCSELADDELDDDITCAQLIYRRGANSFSQWGDTFSNYCGNSTANDQLLEGCDLVHGEPPHVTTSDTNVTLALNNLDRERIQCDAKGTPPITFQWFKNSKKIEPTNPKYMVEAVFVPKENLTISNLKFNYSASREHIDLYKCEAENLYGRDAAEILASIRSESNASGLEVIIAIVATAVIIGIVALTVYRICLRENTGLSRAEIKAFELGTDRSSKAPESEFVYDTLAAQPYNKDVEIVKSDLIFDRTEILGSGQYGIVYKGSYRGKPVAIKTIKPGAGKMYLEALLVELKVMIYIRGHGNVVELIGSYTKELHKGRVYVIIEYCPLGSLLGFLKGSRERWGSSIGKRQSRTFQRYENLPAYEEGLICERQMIGWSYQVAAGMEFLASKKVIHGDLAARNILMLDLQTVKITDFGLSRKLYDYATFIKGDQEPLPWRWLALETIRDLKFSTPSDSWSFGITLWEIFSLGQVPYPGLSWSLDFIRRLEAGLRMSKPEFASESIFTIMVDCWHEEPERRPTFIRIRQSLYQELKKLSTVEYIELDQLEEIATNH